LEKELTILIVEDEITNYLLLKTYLKHPFMNLLYAENGYEAVKMCTNNNDIDIVLMDIKMPVMDGVSAFEKIHSIRPDLPVIAQTAYGMETEKYHFLKIGFNGYISKPIKKDDLFETIKQILKQHQ